MVFGTFLVFLPVFYDMKFTNQAFSIVFGLVSLVVGAEITTNKNEEIVTQIKLKEVKQMTKIKEHRHCIRCGKVIEDMSRTVCEECVDFIIAEVDASELNEAVAKEKLDEMVVLSTEDEDETEEDQGDEDKSEEGDLKVPADSTIIEED